MSYTSAAETPHQKALAEADAYMAFACRVQRANQPCRYGHFGCAESYHGRCCDEAYANLSEEAREIIG